MNPRYWKAISKHDLITSSYWLIILTVSFLLVYRAAFGVIDDHHFTDSILSGKNLKFFIVPESGRFYPLDGQEYNLIAFLSKDPAWFYAFNALELILMAWLLVEIGKLATDGSSVYWPYGIALLLIFSPGFLLAWTRLLTPERNNLILFSIFVFNYLLFKRSHKYRHLIVSLLAATVALFYKETSFIFVGVMGITGWIFGSASRKERVLNSALCLIAVAWLIVYINFYVWAHPSHLYGQTQLSYLKSIPVGLGFFTLSDPLIVASMSSIIYCKFGNFERGQYSKLRTEDILLASGLIYIAAYFFLKLYGYHYLLPIVCIVPYILLKHLRTVDLKTNASKFVIAIFFAIYLTFTLPTAINLFHSNRIIAHNFGLIRQKIVAMSKDWNGENKISLVGLNENRTDEILYSLRKYIRHDTKLPIRVSSEMEDYRSADCRYFADAFSLGCDSLLTYLRKGDVLLLTPYDAVDIAGQLERSKDYSLIYKTNSTNFAVPSMKDFLRYLIVKYGVDLGTSKIVEGTHDKFNFYMYVRN